MGKNLKKWKSIQFFTLMMFLWSSALPLGAEISIKKLIVDKKINENQDIYIGIMGLLTNQCFEIDKISHLIKDDVIEIFIEEEKVGFYFEEAICKDGTHPFYEEYIITKVAPGNYRIRAGDVETNILVKREFFGL